jgi:hypothetical protein
VMTTSSASWPSFASLVVNGQRLQLGGTHLEWIADVMQAQPEQDSHSARPAPPRERLATFIRERKWLSSDALALSRIEAKCSQLPSVSVPTMVLVLALLTSLTIISMQCKRFRRSIGTSQEWHRACKDNRKGGRHES